MSQSTRTGQPSTPLAGSGAGAEPRRQTVTSIIQREIEDFEQQQPRRGRIVGRLIFLQVALMLMTAPLLAWPTVQLGAIGIEAAGLLCYLLAWVRNVTGNARQASLVLLITGVVMTTFLMAGQVLWHPGQILPVGLASFPFLLTIFTAGLLFQPEVVLLISVATTAASTLIFIVALFFTTTPDIPEYHMYYLAVTSLGLQALAGILAWQIAHFIRDYSAELSQAHREEFIATQYDALRRSMDEQSARLHDQVGIIAAGLIDLSTRNYFTRLTNISDPELRNIAEAFNMLAQQLGTVVESEQVQANISDDLMRLIDLVGQMSESGIAGAPYYANMPVAANATGNLLRSATVTLQRAQEAMQQRLAFLRDLSVDAGQRLGKTAEQTYTGETAISTTLATIGHLRAKADDVFGSAEQLSTLIDQTLVQLSALLPPEVSAHTHVETHKPSPTPEMQQVMPGVTIQLEAISEDTELPPPAYQGTGQTPTGTPTTPEGGAGGINPNAQAKLREVWSLISRMTEEVAKQIRDTQVLAEQLGISNKNIRQVDNELIVMRQMTLQVRQIVEQIYRNTSPNHVPTGPLNPTQPPAVGGGMNAADLLSPPDDGGPNRRPSGPLKDEDAAQE
jgi:hypothetical protein